MPRLLYSHRTWLLLLPGIVGVAVWGQAGTALSTFAGAPGAGWRVPCSAVPCLRASGRDPVCDLSVLSLPSLPSVPAAREIPGGCHSSAHKLSGSAQAIPSLHLPATAVPELLSCGTRLGSALTQLHSHVSSSPRQLLQTLMGVLPTLLATPKDHRAHLQGRGNLPSLCSSQVPGINV